jgi:alkyl sulfatase BDS1-like metallo-beta-lactamase superfamily hydrolase
MNLRSSLLICLLFCVYPAFALLTPGVASPATIEKWHAVKKELNFSDRTDFEDSQRGFIARLESDRILGAQEREVFNLKKFDFLSQEAPFSVNPSLWRQGQLNIQQGLFEVVPGIYQVRGLDISNLTLVKGNMGWILVDPLVSSESAKAALDFANAKLGKRPVTGVIFTHSHVDHFGGIHGVLSEKERIAKKIPIIAPVGFVEEATSELVVAGNAMKRRASYMFGSLLPASPIGNVGTGLGQTTSTGSVGMVAPTKLIKKTNEKLTVDGLEIVFQLTPDAEAPAEMVFYFPKYKAFCGAEELSHTMHNLYTLRGAKIRDGLLWSKHINKSIDLFGKRSEVIFGSHHWPIWGQQKIVDFMEKQRDVYKYIHDQTVRLANHGLKMTDIAEKIELPPSLKNNWATRGYYGTLNYNAKAQYNLYWGPFDGNPAYLHPLPEAEESSVLVRLMGGSKKVMKEAQILVDQGSYRMAATVLNKIVMSEKENKDAKELLAKTYEQLGFQAESGPWRNFYLTGALELRRGIDGLPAPYSDSTDMIKSLSIEQALDYLATRLNGPKIGDKIMTFNATLSDTLEKATLLIKHGVLNYRLGEHAAVADAEIKLPKELFKLSLLSEQALPQEIREKHIKVTGNEQMWNEFNANLDRFKFWFPIVTM